MSKSLLVSVLLLNAEVGTYALLEVSFDFTADGRVDKNVRVKLLQVIDPGISAWQNIIPELIWVGLIVMLLRQEVYELLGSIKDLHLLVYAMNLWNIVDWLSIIMGLPIAFYWYVIAIQTGILSENVLAIPRSLKDTTDFSNHRTMWGTTLDDVEWILAVKYYHQLALFWYTTILTFRFLKNFLTQQKLATLQVTLAYSFYDICHFMLIYITLLANFVLGGRILFGATLPEWSSFTRSVGSTIRMLMGHYEFEQMYEIAPVSTSIWFWLFLMVMMFVLSNMLLAIIHDHWHTFRKLIGPTPTILQDAILGLADFFWRYEWHKDQWIDGEYREFFLGDPYDELIEELLSATEVDDDFRRAAKNSSLGCRLKRRYLETSSVDGLCEDGNTPGGKVCAPLDLRKMGADPPTAEHLVEECVKFVHQEKQATDGMNEIRSLCKLIRDTRGQLIKHCDAIEDGVSTEADALLLTLFRMEDSMRGSLEKFASLRRTGADTFAPPLRAQEKGFEPEPCRLSELPLDDSAFYRLIGVPEDVNYAP